MERQKRGWGGATKDLSHCPEMFSLRVEASRLGSESVGGLRWVGGLCLLAHGLTRLILATLGSPLNLVI